MTLEELWLHNTKIHYDISEKEIVLKIPLGNSPLPQMTFDLVFDSTTLLRHTRVIYCNDDVIIYVVLVFTV